MSFMAGGWRAPCLLSKSIQYLKSPLTQARGSGSPNVGAKRPREKQSSNYKGPKVCKEGGEGRFVDGD